MTLKVTAASPEEHAFAGEVNKALRGSGASVTAFEMVCPDNQVRTYHLTISCGTKRTVLTSDVPWHLDGPQDVVKQVQGWVASARAAGRWTTDLQAADGE